MTAEEVAHARDANKFPGKCKKCGLRVEAGAGWLIPGRPGEKWEVIHIPCIAVHTPKAEAKP